MSDLIERMAKAAFDRMQGNLRPSPEHPLGIPRMHWEDEAEVLRDEWRESIRAALRAMVTPSAEEDIHWRDEVVRELVP